MSQFEDTCENASSSILAGAGVGLKAQHYRDVLEEKPDLGFFEVHAENYMGEGGLPHHYLGLIRQDFPLSVHGVGLSLGSAHGIDENHLQKLKRVVERYEPDLVSEHVSWSAGEGAYLNDLLPLPYTEEALGIICENIDRTQSALGRKILVENPSTYLEFDYSAIPEVEFILEISQRTGCGLLLDINNVFVSASNHGFDAVGYLDAIPTSLVGEIHLAGHAVVEVEGEVFRIDDHGSKVIDDVWKLYERVISRLRHVPTLVEWDANLPSFSVLKEEADKVGRLRERILMREESGHVLTA